jgi:hypothetical protein
LSNFGQNTGQVQVKFMRGRVLACVIAAAAIVAQVRKLGNVTICKGPLFRNRWKDCTIAFAVATGVANLNLPPGLFG